MIRVVAEALCRAAWCDRRHTVCLGCLDGKCDMWMTFTNEAEDVIRAVYREHKKTRRWPDFAKEKKA